MTCVYSAMTPGMQFGVDEVIGQMDGLTLALRNYPAGQRRAPHTHSDLTFFLVLSGGMAESCGHHCRQIESFDLVAQTNGVEHSSTVSDLGMRALFLQVSRSWLEHRCISMPDSSAYDLIEDARVVEAMGVALELASGVPEEISVEERILELCCWDPKVAARGGGEAPKWLKIVRDLIHEEYDRPLSLAQLARTAGVHPVHLARVFRERNHRSVSGYVRAVRVKEALRKGRTMPLSVVAAECGFADQSHFCRSVRREFRRTPGEVLSFLS